MRTLAHPDEQTITATGLSAAGSRRTDLESLLAASPPLADLDHLRALVLASNVAGKGSAVSREKVWRQLLYRYVLDPSVPEYRAFTSSALSANTRESERGLLCYLMFARTDRLFRDLSFTAICPNLEKPGSLVDIEHVDEHLRSLLAGHGLTWSEETRIHARQHLLSALRDFGVIEGGSKKRIARLQPGHHVTVFAARLAKLEGRTDRQVLDARWFKLLGVGPEQAASLLYAAGRAGLLSFRIQADVVELQLPPLEDTNE